MRESRTYILGGLCLLVAGCAFVIQPQRINLLSPQATGLLLIATGCIAYAVLRMRRAAAPKTRPVIPAAPAASASPGQERVTMETLPDEARETLSDKRDDAEYLRDILKPMSPLWLLNRVMAQITGQAPRKPVGSVAQIIDLSETRGIGATPHELLAMNVQADARQSMLESNATFQAALARLKTAGISPEWGEAGEYGFTARVLRLPIPLEAISHIEEMAAYDAGIESPDDRREAAETYRRWLLQRYHPDWEQYRERWPTLYENPYCTELPIMVRRPTGLV